MIGILTIARYEVTRRWPLLLIGLGLGLLPIAFEGELADTMLVLDIIVSWTIAFATGMTLVGRPLHDNKLSFYFTRPIAAPSIAAGKIIGGIAVLAGMQAMFVLPVAPYLQLADGIQIAIGLAFGGMVFFAVGLVVGIFARSRSRWFAMDALGGTIAATASVLMFSTIGSRKIEVAIESAKTGDYDGASSLLRRADTLLYTLGVVAAAVLLVSVVVAVAIGRTDRDRVHRALSFTLWPALTATALFGLAFTHWGIR